MTAPLSGELFAGTGMLGRAVGEVFGTRPGWFCEFDAAPSKVLAHHYPDVPNYGDVTKVDFTTVPHTHVRAGGFPCQDVSVSGARAGLRDGTRSGLWSEFARSIAEDRPDWVVIENVGGLLSAEAHSDVEPCPWCLGDEPGEPALRALGAVLADLAALGFDAEWTSIRAADVGAPHGRLRVFILAWPKERTRSGDPLRPRVNPPLPDNVMLLPTPTVVMNDGESVESWTARRERVKATGKNGNGMGMPLPIAVQLLPTVVASDSRDGARHTTTAAASHSGTSLTDAVRLLPTPTAGDEDRGRRVTRGGGQMLTDVILLPTPQVADATGGHANRSGARSGEVLLPGAARNAVNGWGPFAEAVSRWEAIMGRPAPQPQRIDEVAIAKWKRRIERRRDGLDKRPVGMRGSIRPPKPGLNPLLTEWMMGWPLGWVTASVIGLSRAEQLKACGNGVVLQQAVAALRILLARPGVPAVEWELAA